MLSDYLQLRGKSANPVYCELFAHHHPLRKRGNEAHVRIFMFVFVIFHLKYTHLDGINSGH